MNKSKIHNSIFFLFLVYIICINISCTLPKSNRIRIGGSSTMYHLVEELANEYTKTHSNVSINVYGGGSSYAFSDLSSDKIDIGMSSRPISSDEAILFGQKDNTVGLNHIIAKDAIAIYVNKSNPINNLSSDDINKIFNCEITNWSQFGYSNSKITTINRSNKSGTKNNFYTMMQNDKAVCKDAVIVTNNSDMFDILEEEINAIAYGELTFEDNQAKIISIDSIYPSKENINKGKYQLMRYLMLYTKNDTQAHIREFIDWCMSSRGQEVVKKANYIPAWEMGY